MLLLLSSCPGTDPELLWVELDKGKSFAAPVTGCRWQLLKGQVVLACWVEVLLHMRHRNPGAFSQRLSICKAAGPDASCGLYSETHLLLLPEPTLCLMAYLRRGPGQVKF